MRTTTMTPSTPSTMTRTITMRATCMSGHSSTPWVVFLVSLIMCHDLLGSSSLSLSSHVIRMSHMCCCFWFSSTSLSTSTCLSPSSSSPLSWCSLTCRPTSTTWTPWKITCATPPRGASTPTTSPTPSHQICLYLCNDSRKRLQSYCLARFSVWFSGHKPRLTTRGKSIICKTDDFVPLVVPGLSANSGSVSSSVSPPKDSMRKGAERATRQVVLLASDWHALRGPGTKGDGGREAKTMEGHR